MTHEEVKYILNDYFDENLAVEVDSETQNHINDCSECSQYLYSLQDLIKKTDKLPRSLKPKIDFWQDIFQTISSIKSESIKEKEEVELKEARKSEEEEKDKEKLKLKLQQRTEAEKLLSWERKKAEFFGTLKKPLVQKALIAIVSLLVILTVYMLFFAKAESWEIKKFSLGNNTHETAGELSENEILATDAITRVEIQMPGAGSINVAPNSKIQRLNAYNIQLLQGMVSAVKDGDNKLISFIVPGAEIKDYYMSGQYTLSLDDNNVATLIVSEGWTKIVKNDLESLVLPNHICKIIPDSGIGLPYLNTSSSAFIDAINNYCFAIPGNEEALISILTKAEVNNCVTLWNLMNRVTRKQRDMVIYTMFGLLGEPPAGITVDGLKTLDAEMLKNLIEEIELRI